jgi:cyclohexanecarboxylate-CoA ligase/acyl-CoA synthetase
MRSSRTLHAIAPSDRYSASTQAKFRADGYWRDESLARWVDHWAAARPGKQVVTDGDTSLTWSELRAQAYRLAKSLRERGIEAGDRVQVQLPNWTEFVIIYTALARIGAVLVPTMPIYRHDEVKYVLTHSGARLSFVPATHRGFDYADMLTTVRDDCPTLLDVITVRGEPGTGTRLEDLTAGAGVPSDDALGPVPSADAAHCIIYTSGTESRPKGCQHTFNTMGFTMYGLGERVMHIGPESVMFMPSPVTHATGLAIGLAAPMILGASIHLMPTWEARDGLRRIAQDRCTHSMTATPFVRMALDALTEDDDLTSMRAWVSAGAPIPESLLREFREKVPSCSLLPVYGNSEGLLATSCRLDDPPEKTVTSDGRLNDGVRMELRDVFGAPVANGDEGEIAFGGPGLMLGYWDDPEKTDATIGADGLLSTGDMGRFDEDGYLRVTGRIKEIIIRGGTNISAREVEDHLLTHPAVAAVAVVGAPDDRLGEHACAFIVAKGVPPTLADLAEYLRYERKIAVQKLPEELHIVDELPMTATGKVQKFQLVARLAEL